MNYEPILNQLKTQIDKHFDFIDQLRDNNSRRDDIYTKTLADKLKLIQDHRIVQALYDETSRLYFTDIRQYGVIVPYRSFYLIPNFSTPLYATGKVAEVIADTSLNYDFQEGEVLYMNVTDRDGNIVAGEYDVLKVDAEHSKNLMSFLDRFFIAQEAAGISYPLRQIQFYQRGEVDQMVRSFLNSLQIPFEVLEE